jgi:hypothetical protein
VGKFEASYSFRGNSAIMGYVSSSPCASGRGDHEGKSDDEVRAVMDDKFPKHIFHSIAWYRPGFTLPSHTSAATCVFKGFRGRANDAAADPW